MYSKEILLLRKKIDETERLLAGNTKISNQMYDMREIILLTPGQIPMIEVKDVCISFEDIKGITNMEVLSQIPPPASE